MDNRDFSPSVNIVRDKDKELNYIVTPNATKICTQIINGFNTNMHCFSIIGSYGTGKSSFLWAFEQNLLDKNNFFFALNGQFNQYKEFKILNLIGSYNPIQETLFKAIQLKGTLSSESVLNGLEEYYNSCISEGKFLVIILDEFGKFLEFAAKNDPEERVFFLQELAEFVNDPNRNIILLNTLHQNFNAYSKGLSLELKNEWNKVRGRFIELTFNEPIRQLLFLASKQIDSWNFPKSLDNTKIIKAIDESGLLSNSSLKTKNLQNNLFPFDSLSANVLTKAIQDYGQNERSLFTFLARRDEESIYSYASEGRRFNLIEVYNYLLSAYYTQIVDRYNRDKGKWDRIRISIDRANAYIEQADKITIDIIKIIGLLSIYANKGGKLTESFLSDYLQDATVKSALRALEERRIITFRRHLSSYFLTEGSDLDFYQAIEDAGTKISRIENIPTTLNSYYSLPFVHAKRISYETGTPRFFKYLITDSLQNHQAAGEIDGYIYLVINSELTKHDLIDYSRTNDNANIYVLYYNYETIRMLLFEIEKVNYVLAELENDRVAENELRSILENTINQLNVEVLHSLCQGKEKVEWFYHGESQDIFSDKAANQLLSRVCSEIYCKVATVNNELINKHKLSSAISTARKKFVKALISSNNQEYLGIELYKYPPEKTIYQTLLKNTGIHRINLEGNFSFFSPADESFQELWDLGEKFIKESVHEPQPISVFIDMLSSKPFKFKTGFIEFWIPTFIVINQDRFAVFKHNNYLPTITPELFDIIQKYPETFKIKGYPFAGVQIDIFNRYRQLLNIPEKDQLTNKGIIETIKPFLVFYRQLPLYARTTSKMSPTSLLFREALKSAKDPYTAFFETFPESFGYKNIGSYQHSEELEAYILKLKESITEHRLAYNNLLERFENHVYKICGIHKSDWPLTQNKIRDSLDSVDIDLLDPSHRRLLVSIRISSETKIKWIESLGNSVINKSLSEISDAEEEVLYTNFEKLYNNLLKTISIHEIIKKAGTHDAYHASIVDSSGKRNEVKVILSQDKKRELEKIEKEIKILMNSTSKDIRQAIGVRLLKS
jgi:hypothetical protein